VKRVINNSFSPQNNLNSSWKNIEKGQTKAKNKTLGNLKGALAFIEV
jgi:hypothetical protein